MSWTSRNHFTDELKEAERVLKSILKVGSMLLKSKLMSWTLHWKKNEKYGVWKFTKQNAAGSSDGDSSHHIILRTLDSKHPCQFHFLQLFSLFSSPLLLSQTAQTGTTRPLKASIACELTDLFLLSDDFFSLSLAVSSPSTLLIGDG